MSAVCPYTVFIAIVSRSEIPPLRGDSGPEFLKLFDLLIVKKRNCQGMSRLPQKEKSLMKRPDGRIRLRGSGLQFAAEVNRRSGTDLRSAEFQENRRPTGYAF